MNLYSYIGRKVKINVEQEGRLLTYNAIIVLSDGEQTTFTDKFGKEITVPSEAIKMLEVDA